LTGLKTTRFICLDCETTGLDLQKDKIIEIGVALFTFSEVIQEYETLVDPCCDIPEISIAIHHITAEMVAGKPKIKEVLPQVIGMIGKEIIIGHGINFDIQMIVNAARESGVQCLIQNNPIIDTLRLARHYGDSPTNSLNNLALHFNVPVEETHRAMADVKINMAVFKHLVSRFQTTEQIFKLLSQPIKMKYMPLGKYKGRPFSELPLDYLMYAAKLDFDQDLKFTIRLELKARKAGGQFSQATNPFCGL
jgi:DNA polymerase-3 subunit epsilon